MTAQDPYAIMTLVLIWVTIPLVSMVLLFTALTNDE